MKSAETKTADELEDESSPFECNICLEMAKEPVVTFCGHLYCWPCLAKWFRMQQGSRLCPVCKSDLKGDRVVPIYCRASESIKSQDLERRPAGKYLESETHTPMPPMISQMNGMVDGQPPGIWSTLFGFHTGPRMTPEQQHQAFLTRLLLVLGSVVILCLLLF